MKRIINLITFFLAMMLLAGAAYAVNEYTLDGLNAFSTYHIKSSPEVAQIYLDDKYVGETPAKVIGLTTGEHTITLKAQGYMDYSKVIKVERGQSGKILAALTSNSGVVAQKNWPVLTVNCNTDCNVYINNELSYDKDMDLDFGTYNIKVLPNDKDHHSYNTVLDLTEAKNYEFNTYLSTFEEHYSYENRVLLTLYSNPSDADVIIDGKNYGKTPLGIASLSLDNHNLTLKKNGYLNHDQIIKKTNGKGTRYNTLTIDLTAGTQLEESIENENSQTENLANTNSNSQDVQETKTPAEIASKYISIENTVQTEDTYIFTGKRSGKLFGLFNTQYDLKVYVYKDNSIKKEGPWYDFLVTN